MTRALANDRLYLLTVFVAVVDASSFAGAARQLGISPPSVTRAVAELERQLGRSLLARTTRCLRLTAVGTQYVEDCRRILIRLREAEAAVSGLQPQVDGHLTLTAPALFGARYVASIVTEYLHRYPRARASCLFLDRTVDLIDEGVDIAFRVGRSLEKMHQSLPIGLVRPLICATPEYLAKSPPLRSPSDLKAHSIIATSGNGAPIEWQLVYGREMRGINLVPRLATTTEDAALRLALNGIGVAMLKSYYVREHLASGRLVTVLDDYAPPPLRLNLVYREGSQMSGKVRAFMDLAVERLRAEPALAG